MKKETKKVLTEDQIIDALAIAFGFDRFEVLYKRSRIRELVDCRQLIMYFMRKYVKSKTKKNEPMPLQAIGRYFKKHHATVMHSIETVEGYAATNKEYKAKLDKYDKILSKLGVDDICPFCHHPLEKQELNLESIAVC